MRSKPKTKNALSHGLYANDLVLAWENEQDFMDLYQGIRRQLRPNGTLQDEVVLDIAQLHWRKRRVHIGMQLAYRGHPDADAMAKAAARQSKTDAPGIRRTRMPCGVASLSSGAPLTMNNSPPIAATCRASPPHGSSQFHQS